MTFCLSLGKRTLKFARPCDDHQLFIEDCQQLTMAMNALAQMAASEKLSDLARGLDRVFDYVGFHSPVEESAHILNNRVVWYGYNYDNA
jgi:hypothetical protein